MTLFITKYLKCNVIIQEFCPPHQTYAFTTITSFDFPLHDVSRSRSYNLIIIFFFNYFFAWRFFSFILVLCATLHYMVNQKWICQWQRPYKTYRDNSNRTEWEKKEPFTFIEYLNAHLYIVLLLKYKYICTNFVDDTARSTQRTHIFAYGNMLAVGRRIVCVLFLRFSQRHPYFVSRTLSLFIEPIENSYIAGVSHKIMIHRFYLELKY